VTYSRAKDCAYAPADQSMLDAARSRTVVASAELNMERSPTRQKIVTNA
jgi:hypothetical protein